MPPSSIRPVERPSRVQSGRSQPPLRLTRRGRRVVLLGVVLLALVLLLGSVRLASGIAAMVRGGDPATAAPPAPEAVAADEVTEQTVGAASPEPVAAPPRDLVPNEPVSERPARQLPVPVSAVSAAGSGELTTAPGRDDAPAGSGRLIRYRVLVEDGLTVLGDPVDGAAFAEVVHGVLSHRRGWQAVDGVRFARVARGPSDVDVVLASPVTTDAMCAPLLTYGNVSCFNGSDAVLNAVRWFSGADSYGKDLIGYRSYLVSHEVGHFLGKPHVGCPSPGAPAPVMVQQTKSLYGCVSNSWPAKA